MIKKQEEGWYPGSEEKARSSILLVLPLPLPPWPHLNIIRKSGHKKAVEGLLCLRGDDQRVRADRGPGARGVRDLSR